MNNNKHLINDVFSERGSTTIMTNFGHISPVSRSSFLYGPINNGKESHPLIHFTENEIQKRREKFFVNSAEFNSIISLKHNRTTIATSNNNSIVQQTSPTQNENNKTGNPFVSHLPEDQESNHNKITGNIDETYHDNKNKERTLFDAINESSNCPSPSSVSTSSGPDNHENINSYNHLSGQNFQKQTPFKTKAVQGNMVFKICALF
ncbi:unnamed protein product [Heterobilharzia americana]|nr:unnamed protein product [Heterobilharzia americana]